MPEGYRHLTFDGRCRIYATGKGGLSNGAIAGRPGRHPATISREIRRDGGGRGYRQGQAWRKATGRRSGASSVPGKLTEERRAKVVGHLEEGWSPERIAGRLRLEDPGMVGRQRIYDLVRADRRDGGTPCGHLRRRGKEPDRQGGRHAGRGHVPGRRDIPERPKEGGGGRRGDDRPSRGSRCQGPHDHGGQRQGVRGAREGGEGAGGRFPPRDALPLVGAGPERAHQRAAAPAPAEGDRPAAGHGRPREAGPGHPERAPRRPTGRGNSAGAPARFRSGHPLPRPEGRATSRRGALPPPGGPVTLRSEGTAAAFRVESGPLAGKSLNTGPPPPLGATPSLRRRAGVALRTGSGEL